MASIRSPGFGITDWVEALARLEELYDPEAKKKEKGKAKATDDDLEFPEAQYVEAVEAIVGGPDGHDPSIAIPRLREYLRDKDKSLDTHWRSRFAIIKTYLKAAEKKMEAGGLGFNSAVLRDTLVDALEMVKTHERFEKFTQGKTPWTTQLLHGKRTLDRLLTYPTAFPRSQPNLARSRYRPVRPTPRPERDNQTLWTMSLKIVNPTDGLTELTEVDRYVESENEYFKSAQDSTRDVPLANPDFKESRFGLETTTYEHYMSSGLEEVVTNPPPLYSGAPDPSTKGPDNPDGTKGRPFYLQRGWQRAALQLSLNLFTNHENRAINTPWRRPVLPFLPAAPLPKEVPFSMRLPQPKETEGRYKDPFSWLQWSSDYTRIINFLAGAQRRNYEVASWDNFDAAALPMNFRGPQIYRGLAVHDQHYLKMGESLSSLEVKIHQAWGTAPRPLLRVILRDIDAGRHENTGGPVIGNHQLLAAEESDDALYRKRYWRRDIRRRNAIDNRNDSFEDDDFKLLDEFDIKWLRYLCEPSRTVEMCDPAKLPRNNLDILFDAKLQSFFRDLEASGTLDSQGLDLWFETPREVERLQNSRERIPLTKVLAYINGCKESELKYSGSKRSDPDHPNQSYQFSIEEGEFFCAKLHTLGRCVYQPSVDGEPSKVDRPAYLIHPEDRVLWRYADHHQFEELNALFVDDMVEHYSTIYGTKAQCNGDKFRFFREVKGMMEHVGPGFVSKLAYIESGAPEEVLEKREDLIYDHIVPEGLCHIGMIDPDNSVLERDAPRYEDLATWEAVGKFLSHYRDQNKDKAPGPYYSSSAYLPQTPERTVQFFRNLAYRMGRTLRYIDQVKDRLQAPEESPENLTLKTPLDLSSELKEPGPEVGNDMPANTLRPPPVVEKWWNTVPPRNFSLAIRQWEHTIEEGAGDVSLLPPKIEEVLEKADPNGTYKHPLKEELRNPYTIIREGIIDDCFQNRPATYPGRTGGFKGFKGYLDKEYEARERPNLFEWATKEQRRFQAQHTRRHFFNMQRWPPSRIAPDRLEAIRNRKDEVLKYDPSSRGQSYGILTQRVPVGKEKPMYGVPYLDGDRYREHNLTGPSGDDFDFDDGSLNPPRPPADDRNLPGGDTPPPVAGGSAPRSIFNRRNSANNDGNAADNKDDLIAPVDVDLITTYANLRANANPMVSSNNSDNRISTVDDGQGPTIIPNDEGFASVADGQGNGRADNDLFHIDGEEDSDLYRDSVRGASDDSQVEEHHAEAHSSPPTTMSSHHKAHHHHEMEQEQEPMATVDYFINDTLTLPRMPDPMDKQKEPKPATLPAPMNGKSKSKDKGKGKEIDKGKGKEKERSRRRPINPEDLIAERKRMLQMIEDLQPMDQHKGLIPITRDDAQFAPGPALFPMGDTLLQKVMISHELSDALYPEVPFYQDSYFGLPKFVKRLTGARNPLIPLVPEVAKADLPRSNPVKRKMPIEFLNVPPSSKKFCSTKSVGMRAGGIGGQFAAGVPAPADKGDKDTDTDSEAPSPSRGIGTRTRQNGRATTSGTQIRPAPAPTRPTNGQSATNGGQATRGTQGQATPAHTPVMQQGPMTPVSVRGQGTPKPTHPDRRAPVQGTSVQPIDLTNVQIEQVTIPATPESHTNGNGIEIIDIRTPPEKPETTIRTRTPIIRSVPLDKPGQPSPSKSTTSRSSEAAPIQHSTPQTRPAATPQPTFNTTAIQLGYLDGLRIFPDPCPGMSKIQFVSRFPTGWFTSHIEIQNPYHAALMALSFSLNKQLALRNLSANFNDLQALSTSDACHLLKAYTQATVHNFDMHCANYLLQVWGEQHGLKLQLGVAQEDPTGLDKNALRGTHGTMYSAFMVGSKYNDDPDKHIIWVRISRRADWAHTFVNPYSLHIYNCYTGVGEVPPGTKPY